MIHDIGLALQAQLTAKACPVKVVDGPEPTGTTTWGRSRIVIERVDAERPQAVRSQRPNPQHTIVRVIGAKITIYAQSTRTGAKGFEHEFLADELVDQVIVALNAIAGGEEPIYNVWTWAGGSYVVPPDLEGSERNAGAVYEMLVSFERAVYARTWTTRAIATEVAFGPVVMSGDPDLTFTAADDTIARDAGSWITDGFAIGQTVRIVGSASNDVTGEVTAVTASGLALDVSLTNEGPVSGCSVTAGGTATARQVATNGSDFEAF